MIFSCIQFSHSVVSDSVRPHRRQPTRLCLPWDSPGKNTGVGCQCLLHCVKVKNESEVAQSRPTCSGPHGLQPTRLLHPWDFLGRSTGVACHCLLHQGKLGPRKITVVAVEKHKSQVGESLVCILSEIFLFLKRHVENLIGIPIMLKGHIKHHYIILWQLLKKFIYN